MKTILIGGPFDEEIINVDADLGSIRWRHNYKHQAFQLNDKDYEYVAYFFVFDQMVYKLYVHGELPSPLEIFRKLVNNGIEPLSENESIKIMKCPECGYLINRASIEQARHNFSCPRCNTHKMPDFLPDLPLPTPIQL
jgi:ssDNA-binding Zn-finger/Zn-ribbon topoisomerase 1